MRASSSGLTPGRAPVRVNGSGVIMKVPALEYVIVFVTAVCAAGCGSASSGSAPPVIQPGAPGQQVFITFGAIESVAATTQDT